MSVKNVRKQHFGESNPYWKGGIPNCVDCGKQKKCRIGERCRLCAMKIKGAKQDVSGEKNPNWRGGPKDNMAERIKFSDSIRREVLKRDNYTCQMCGGKKKLQVDHIQRWSEYVELRFDINNCRTLCMECHYQITYGRPMPKEIEVWGGDYRFYERIT